MADVSSVEEKDWGPEQSECPPEGSIFLLRLYPNSFAPHPYHYKYKLIKRDGNELELCMWADNQWHNGHQWGLLSKPTFRLLLSDSTIVCAASASASLVNNYTCVLCKNDRLSCSEKSCWKCGEPVNRV